MLVPLNTYRIKLCSGEIVLWTYLGPQDGEIWWRDEETTRVFCESSVQYAWEVL